MKHTVRAFSVGLITSGIILLAVYLIFGQADEKKAELSTEELISQIEEDGYRVVTEEEYIMLSVANSKKDKNENTDKDEKEKEDDAVEDEEIEEAEDKDEVKENEGKDDNKKEKKKEKKEKKPKTFTITIEPGMASSQISNLLEELGIIDDAREFSNYLIDNDYHKLIQMGEHKLESGMSYFEIAEALSR